MMQGVRTAYLSATRARTITLRRTRQIGKPMGASDTADEGRSCLPDRCEDVDRDGDQLSLGTGVAETDGDGGKVEGERVDGAEGADVDDEDHVDLPVEQTSDDEFPLYKKKERGGVSV
jgi:hypothetical protein